MRKQLRLGYIYMLVLMPPIIFTGFFVISPYLLHVKPWISITMMAIYSISWLIVYLAIFVNMRKLKEVL